MPEWVLQRRTHNPLNGRWSRHIQQWGEGKSRYIFHKKFPLKLTNQIVVLSMAYRWHYLLWFLVLRQNHLSTCSRWDKYWPPCQLGPDKRETKRQTKWICLWLLRFEGKWKIYKFKPWAASWKQLYLLQSHQFHLFKFTWWYFMKFLKLQNVTQHTDLKQ